jgi:hypothetical protein
LIVIIDMYVQKIIPYWSKSFHKLNMPFTFDEQ